MDTGVFGSFFTKIKTALTTDQVLIPYNPNLPMNIQTDASPVGISAILSPRKPDGNFQPIAFASRSLSKAEGNYAHS